MITVTKLNGKQLIVNAELIEMIEETPDTIVTLLNGHKLIVKESSTELVDMMLNYKRKIFTKYI